MSDADTLRRAAALMRENATTTEGMGDPWFDAESLVTETDDYIDAESAEHIASWHPAVALAVADWLDEVAGWREEGLGLMPTGNLADAWGCIERQAITVARAYSGESA